MLGFAALGVTAVVFYFVQNGPAGVGGSIAPVKVLWLFTVIAFWYLLPLLFATDRSLASSARIACWLLVANMILRAIIELGLMYVSHGWKHSYGVGHDVFSLVLCFALAYSVRRQRWLALFFLYGAVLFAFESYFALYLRRIADADGSVFFLPSSEEHSAILQATGWVVAVSVVFGFYVCRRWMNATAARAGSDH